jgi:hypothetical protein
MCYVDSSDNMHYSSTLKEYTDLSSRTVIMGSTPVVSMTRIWSANLIESSKRSIPFLLAKSTSDNRSRSSIVSWFILVGGGRSCSSILLMTGTGGIFEFNDLALPCRHQNFTTNVLHFISLFMSTKLTVYLKWRVLWCYEFIHTYRNAHMNINMTAGTV